MSEWLSVNDSPPDFDMGIVLIFAQKEVGSYPGVFASIWEKPFFSDWPPNCGCTGFGKVTHWMPLPKAPNE